MSDFPLAVNPRAYFSGVKGLTFQQEIQSIRAFRFRIALVSWRDTVGYLRVHIAVR